MIRLLAIPVMIFSTVMTEMILFMETMKLEMDQMMVMISFGEVLAMIRFMVEVVMIS